MEAGPFDVTGLDGTDVWKRGAIGGTGGSSPSSSSGPLTPTRYGGPDFVFGTTKGLREDKPDKPFLPADFGRCEVGGANCAVGVGTGRPTLLDRRRGTIGAGAGPSRNGALECDVVARELPSEFADNWISARLRAARFKSLIVFGPFPATGRFPRIGGSARAVVS
jgi:hypothetical protein